MPVEAVCVRCEKTYRVSSKLRGQRVRCPGCKGGIDVPGDRPAEEATEGADALAALAAAESAAEPLMERRYDPPPKVEMPRVAARRATGGGDEGPEGGWRSWVRRPMFYVQGMGAILFLAALTGSDLGLQAMMIFSLLAAVLCLVLSYGFALLDSFRGRTGLMLFGMLLFAPLLPLMVVLTALTNPSKLGRSGRLLLHMLPFIAYMVIVLGVMNHPQ